MPGKILLVDDEEGIRKVLGLTLGELGYEVFTAKDGRNGLEVFKAERPPLVVTDLRMPGMGGLELLSAIKEIDSETEVIIITGHGDMDLAIEGLKRDAADFIQKPIDDEALEIALKRAEEKLSLRAKMREYTQNLETLVREQSAQLVKLSRREAACQAAEDMALAMRCLAGEFYGDSALFNSLPSFVSFLDRELNLVFANQAYCDKFGQRLGQPGYLIYENETSGNSPAGLCLASGLAWQGERVLLYANGGKALAEVRCAPLRGPDGEVDLIMEFATDLGETRRLKDELAKMRALFERLFNEAPMPVAVLDSDLKLKSANRMFETQFGLEGGALSLRPAAKGESGPGDSPLHLTLADGETHQFETAITGLGGEIRNLYVTSAALFAPDGKLERLMEFSTDITKLRQLQDHLASLGMLLASLSHGIKGILTALDGGVYQVDSGLARQDPERVQAGWGTVKNLVARVKGMILDILYYSRKRELNLSQVSLSALAREVAEVVEIKAEAADVELVVEAPDSLGEASLDSGVLSAALVNLLENAIEACALDRSKSEHQVILRIRREDPTFCIEIADNGSGMDERTKNKIFSVFFSTKGSKGTGLGLFITKHAADQHGGSLEIESEPGQGSTFRMRLPLVQPEKTEESGLGL